VRASDVVLPEGAVFVVANSLAVSNKAESATKHYNLRVVECRWALRQLGLWPALTWLSVCMQAISGLWLRASISCPVLSCPVVLLRCRLATGVLALMLGESKVRGRSGGLCSPNFGSHYCMSCC
jgi:hypothetical protein